MDSLLPHDEDSMQSVESTMSNTNPEQPPRFETDTNESELDENTTFVSLVREEQQRDSTGPEDVTMDGAENTVEGEETNDSMTPKKNLNRVITDDVTYKFTSPKDVIEYQWPELSGERWMVMEQVSELLQVTAFKRRFPHLQTRPIELEEKTYLIANYKINTLLTDIHLQNMRALRASEVLSLLCQEKPDLYTEYQRVVNERLQQAIAERKRAMDKLIKDPAALAELRKSCMKSAHEYNEDLQRYKKLERQTYWDTQTSIIQSSARKWKKLPPEMTRPSPYPCALLPGQFQHYYKRFTRDELHRMPLGSIIDTEDLWDVPREHSPPPIAVSQDELGTVPETSAKPMPQEQSLPQKYFAEPSTQNGLSTPKRQKDDFKHAEVPTPRQSELRRAKCTMCNEPPSADRKMVRCAACHATTHTACAEMTDEMVAIVLSYPWRCMECKVCTICTKMGDEKDLMFCDRCDRGYHTYCVGMKNAPTGSWICKKFCEPEKEEKNEVMTPTSTRPRRRVSAL